MFDDFRLRVFVKVAELGSFTAAARALGITQPAVSQHIAELEKFAGGLLFERGRGPVSLTERGRNLLAHARGILGSYKQLENEFRIPESILIRDVLLDGRRTNILIRGDRFEDLDAPEDTPADRVIDADGAAIFPGFFDARTQAAPPRDSAEQTRRGGEHAIHQMGACGTTFFSDTGSDAEETVAAVEASCLRAAVGIPYPEQAALRDYITNWKDPSGGRIQLVMTPDAPLAASAEQIKRCANFARHHGLLLHLRLAATRPELEACVKAHGATPVRWLEKLGLLGQDVLASQCTLVDAEEWKILARRGVTAAHCPGAEVRTGGARFPYELALESGCRITLGSDGAGSLNLHGAMRAALLLASLGGRPNLLTPEEVFRWATRNGAGFFGIDAGRIAAGAQADAVLVAPDAPTMRSGEDLLTSWILSADSGAVRHVICGGRILKLK